MKLFYLNMYKKISYIAAIVLLLAGVSADAQITTQSPYSRFGVGNVKGALLPQFRAMGGISTAIGKPTGYSNINMQNPASYTGIGLTTVDIGASGSITTLKRSGEQEKSFNSTLSHLALAFPLVQERSVLSFGLQPYSELGYEYMVQGTLDTNTVNYLYSGEGGLTKAYIGFGQKIGQNFSVGANLEYLFGNLQESAAMEFQSFSAINNRRFNKNSVGGIAFSYGAQYRIPTGTRKSLTLGYSGSSSSSVNSRKTYLLTQYLKNALGEDLAAFDTLSMIDNGSAKLKLPLVHNFGIAFQSDNKWLFGADYRMGKWSDVSIGGESLGLEDSWGFSAGGQFVPDAKALSGYFNYVEYRLGVTYDKTYIRTGGQDIKQMAVTFGLGLPLAFSRNALYKVNLSTEIGKRGNMTNGFIQENYVNFHIGFTLNDTWFRRWKFD